MKRIPKATVTRAIKRLVRAEINGWYATRQYSSGHAAITKELTEARAALDALIKKLIDNQRDSIEDIVKGLKK